MENKLKINPFIRSLFQNIDSSGYTYNPLTTSMIQGYHLITRNTNSKAHTHFNGDSSFRNKDSKRSSFNNMTTNIPKNFQSSVNSKFNSPVKNQNSLLTPTRHSYYFKPISDYSKNQRFYKSNNQTSNEQIIESIRKSEKYSQENMIVKQPNIFKEKELTSGNFKISTENLSQFVSENVRIKKLLIKPTVEENKLRLSLKNKQNLKQRFEKELNEKNENRDPINCIYSYEQSNPKKSKFKTIDKSNFSEFKENRMQKPEDDKKMLKNQNKTEQELKRQRSEILIDLIANEKLMKQKKLMQQRFDNMNFIKGDLSQLTNISNTYCKRVPEYENLLNSYNQNLNSNYHHNNKAKPN